MKAQHLNTPIRGRNAMSDDTIQQKLSRPIDEVLLMHSVLRRLGTGRVSSFKERLASQKYQYLAQRLGLSVSYYYNLYLHGPYSPALAADLFRLSETDRKGEKQKFITHAKEDLLRETKTRLSKERLRVIEIAATLDWLKKIEESSKDALQRLQAHKAPTQAELESAQRLLEDLGL